MGTSEAARKGGLARMRLYGNFGTAEGRRLGGLRSVAAQKKGSTGFVLLRRILFPKESTILAELLGILAGDGHVGAYQVTMTTNSDTDKEHALYVKSLFENLFKLPVSFSLRRDKKACVVFVSSKEVSRFLIKKGLVKGHKIRGGLRIPPWVMSKVKYRLAFVRGVFDTDGCVFVDRHTIKGRLYEHIGMAFTNHSIPLLADFKETLEFLGLHPTQKTKYTVFLRRRKDIARYFELVGSSNPKHLRKVAHHFPLDGGVA